MPGRGYRFIGTLESGHVAPISLPPRSEAREGRPRGCGASGLADAGPAIEVECRRLDSLLVDAEPSFIKMDFEGVELDALAGASEIMARHRPVMAICAYHKCDHLWIIPQLLQVGNPDYRIFLAP